MLHKVSAIDRTADEYEWQLEHKEYYASKVANLKPESRRRLEVLAVRCLLKDMLGEEQNVVYDEFGAPSLSDNNLFISISHTDGYVAAIVGDRPVGIDIERRGKRVERVKSKFLQASEEILVDGLCDPMLAMHLIWSAKEAAFKFLGQKYYDLQNLTCITRIDFEERFMTMKVEGRNKPLTIHFEYTDEYVLCYSISD